MGPEPGGDFLEIRLFVVYLNHKGCSFMMLNDEVVTI